MNVKYYIHTAGTRYSTKIEIKTRYDQKRKQSKYNGLQYEPRAKKCGDGKQWWYRWHKQNPTEFGEER